MLSLCYRVKLKHQIIIVERIQGSRRQSTIPHENFVFLLIEIICIAKGVPLRILHDIIKGAAVSSLTFSRESAEGSPFDLFTNDMLLICSPCFLF